MNVRRTVAALGVLTAMAVLGAACSAKSELTVTVPDIDVEVVADAMGAVRRIALAWDDGIPDSTACFSPTSEAALVARSGQPPSEIESSGYTGRVRGFYAECHNRPIDDDDHDDVGGILLVASPNGLADLNADSLFTEDRVLDNVTQLGPYRGGTMVSQCVFDRDLEETAFCEVVWEHSRGLVVSSWGPGGFGTETLRLELLAVLDGVLAEVVEFEP